MRKRTLRLIRPGSIAAAVGLISAAFGPMASCSQQETESPLKPNVVLVVIDTLRADHLPFYGYGRNTAPFLARLAKQSILFERAYATSSWTAPSTASLFTSLYPFQHGVVTGLVASVGLSGERELIELNRIPDELVTIAESFKQRGYRTFGVSDNLNICQEEGFDPGFDRFENYTYRGAGAVNQTLREWEQEIKGSGAYFLYLHYMDPHVPYHPRKPWFKAKGSPLQKKIAAYDSEISYVDGKLGEMFDLFEWDQNTILIFTSDHGEEFFEHGKKGHSKALFQESIHVPLLFYPASKLAEGPKRVGWNVSIIDILPTLREILEWPASQTDEGISLLPLMRADAAAAKGRALFAHLLREKAGRHGEGYLLEAVVLQDDKYLVDSRGEEKLFDLGSDPGERENLVEQDPERARSMRERLRGFQRSCQKYDRETAQMEMDDRLLEELRALGYLNQ
jgi:arylsulfatase A-like enzyme